MWKWPFLDTWCHSSKPHPQPCNLIGREVQTTTGINNDHVGQQTCYHGKEWSGMGFEPSTIQSLENLLYHQSHSYHWKYGTSCSSSRSKASAEFHRHCCIYQAEITKLQSNLTMGDENSKSRLAWCTLANVLSTFSSVFLLVQSVCLVNTVAVVSWSLFAFFLCESGKATVLMCLPSSGPSVFEGRPLKVTATL